MDSYFCDYYRGSTPWAPERLLPVLAYVVPVVSGDHGKPVQVQPLYRGDVALVRKIGDSQVLRVEYGGQYGDGSFFASSGLSGAAARMFDAVRGDGVPHRVTRMDVACDFEAPGVADRAFAVAFELANEYGLKVEQAGDWRPADQRQGTRTLYLGSRRSEFFIRLYEKGLTPDFIGLGRPDWFRVEAQYTPEKVPQKQQAAALSLAEVFCSRKWAAALIGRLGVADTPIVQIGKRKHAPDLERSVKAFAMQYRRMWERMRGLCGSDEGTGRYLGLVVDLLHENGGFHDFSELRNAGCVAEFCEVQTHRRVSQGVGAVVTVDDDGGRVAGRAESV